MNYLSFPNDYIKRSDTMSVKTYSVKRDGNIKLSSNFTVNEFACHDGSDTVLIDDRSTDSFSMRLRLEKGVIFYGTHYTT